ATLVYVFHAQSYVLLGVCITALFAIHWQGWRWAVRRAPPFGPSLMLFMLWYGSSFPSAMPKVQTVTSQNEVTRGAGPKTRYEPIGAVLSKIPERLVGTYNDGSDYRIAGALLAVFLAALVSAGGPLPRRLRGMLVERPGEALCLLLFASYVATPIELAGQWYVSPRHLVFSLLLAPAFLNGRATGFRRIFLAPACALGLWASADAATKVRAFQEQVGPFAEVLDHMEPGER